MRTRLAISAFLLVPAVAAGYMAWISWRADDDGKWLFGVFSLFFLLAAAAPFLPAPRKKPDAGSMTTGFAPHWALLFAVLALLAAVLAGIIAAVVRWLG